MTAIRLGAATLAILLAALKIAGDIHAPWILIIAFPFLPDLVWISFVVGCVVFIKLVILSRRGGGC